MELILTRIAKRKGYTIGRLSLPPAPPKGRGEEKGTDRTYLCDTLEPPALEMKTRVDRQTVLRSVKKVKGLKPFAIPEGRYAVVVTRSPKFDKWLPLLVGDQNFNRLFQGIRIHAGNTAKDTQGCILPGENLRKGMVLNSARWVKRIKDLIVEAKAKGEAVWLTIE